MSESRSITKSQQEFEVKSRIHSPKVTLGAGSNNEEFSSEVDMNGLSQRNQRPETPVTNTWIRIITLLLYLLSMSLAAFILATYYLLIWIPSEVKRKINFLQANNSA